MQADRSARRIRLGIVGVATLVYFISYPEDLLRVLAPLRQLLLLSEAISPWLYGLLAVAVISWAAVQLWGRPRRPAHPDRKPPRALNDASG